MISHFILWRWRVDDAGNLHLIISVTSSLSYESEFQESFKNLYFFAVFCVCVRKQRSLVVVECLSVCSSSRNLVFFLSWFNCNLSCVRHIKESLRCHSIGFPVSCWWRPLVINIRGIEEIDTVWLWMKCNYCWWKEAWMIYFWSICI